MNSDIISGNWKEIKGKVTQQWGNITNDDITHMHGTHDELEGLLQKKYGYEKDAAQKEIDNFIKQYGWHE